jgi:hypothetical protein
MRPKSLNSVKLYIITDGWYEHKISVRGGHKF